MRLILASRSPRRRELLREAGYLFEVIAPSDKAEHLDAEAVGSESPAELAARLAWQKAADVARNISAGIVIGCDTIVECQGKILGKPADQEDARQILLTLSGQEHWVYSGLCVWPVPSGEPLVRVAKSRLRMDPLQPEQLQEYLQSGQWEGKSGAFGYQDRLGWVHLIEGSESNVVGLPLELLAEMLAEIDSNWRPPRDASKRRKRKN